MPVSVCENALTICYWGHKPGFYHQLGSAVSLSHCSDWCVCYFSNGHCQKEVPGPKGTHLKRQFHGMTGWSQETRAWLVFNRHWIEPEEPLHNFGVLTNSSHNVPLLYKIRRFTDFELWSCERTRRAFEIYRAFNHIRFSRRNPFANFGASKSIPRRFWTIYNSQISWSWGIEIVTWPKQSILF